MDNPSSPMISKEIEDLEQAVIRFCGDSGDGMQITGTRFTQTTALLGNDLATLPDFPAEIRAPAGSLAGVSGYQIHFSSKEIRTPGDAPDVLVAMNPAALKTNLKDLKSGGILIVNSDAFNEENLNYAGYKSNPIDDGSLGGYKTYTLPITTLNNNSLKDSTLPRKEKERCKNFFALGLMFWLYDRPYEDTLKWIDAKFSDKDIADANKNALKGGYFFGETTDAFKKSYRIGKAKLPAGIYRHITGNEATALGFIGASQLANKPLFYASYPITPASDILHELSKHKNLGVQTCQAEDEIAAIGMSLGAAFAGDLALTGTSGPGLALKSETLSLAISMELPLVVINVQRGGPSTGLPTKTEQSDLLQACFGRHGEAPLAVIAPSTPVDCFDMAIEASRIAFKYMTPVLYLSDGYLANGAEPWKLPEYFNKTNSEQSEREGEALTALPAEGATRAPIITWNHPTDTTQFKPFLRNDKTLARPWAIPGTPGLEHRLGGLEKQDVTGSVSYDPNNHETMVKLRAEKIARIAKDIPPTLIHGKNSGDILVIGWGSTYGAITTAVDELQKEGLSVSSIHLRYLNPLPPDLEKILSGFKTVIIPEMNLGQLSLLLRAKFLVNAQSLTKVQGKPFKVEEIVNGIKNIWKPKQTN